ncbi:MULTISPECIES: site-specific DNA-methyltransferase [Micrococcus]|uniref:DNA methyltransferase n=2 Tax=Micrococcus TaxID=1269 RepID=A0AAP3ANA1_MICLU|nr:MULTISPECIES: DNA methyltransferase [Micrococcus]MCV7591346.1 DNA methyltransferase [Micrococcus luteus]MCV7629848.1 DNA methyltransferase [Micrococcus luteus]PKZ80701.1 site-specific DNA-methyltransferase [Micrococcus luteus]
MSRLTDLLAQARKTDPQLATDLEAEFRQLTRHNQFGLVFERHQPEAVELPGRPVRRGDTVRVLPPRGTLTIGDTRHWVVTDLERTPDGKQAHLTEADVDPEVREPATSTAAIEDLVVVARFEDPIYPGLVETGRVENGGDKPFHTVINAENFHALAMLTYTHRHKVDCVYIDPPYNTGAKDWKYNNDYVASDDDYRHSKWLSFMERRLQVARELLNPEDSVLIVTIDEKEYLRLGMLLEQTFPDARIQMVSSVINPKGVARGKAFRRTDEYIYFVMLGESGPARLPLGPGWQAGAIAASTSKPEGPGWTSLMRRGSHSARSDRPGLYYPIFVDPEKMQVVAAGDPIPLGERTVAARPGLTTVLPIRTDQSEGNWQCSGPELMRRLDEGRVRVGRETHYGYVINYLPEGAWKEVCSPAFEITGRAPDGSVEAVRIDADSGLQLAPTQWKIEGHNASEHGSSLLRRLMPGRKFPFPKALYAVEDTLRFFVKDKPNAVILDFFSGSGTTAHAVMRLNKQDGGHRQCISVTNNEVSAEEQKGLRAKGLRPGDAEWEQWGICDYVTKPRVTAAITGKTPDGDPIKGEYKFTDEFPMADGFEENAAFFTLTYEAPRQVRRNRAFARIAPMLWLKAGSRGRIISSLPERGWDVAQTYGVLEDMDHAPEFLAALEADPQVGMAFIVTDSEVAFQSVARQLPEHTTAVRLYESYLHNFQINRRA